MAGGDQSRVGEQTAPSTAADVASAERIVYRQRLDILLASCTASQRITGATLTQGGDAAAAVNAVAAVAAYADTAQDIVTRAYHPAVDCQEGCSYCCRKPGVLVTIPEAIRIVGHVRATLQPDALAHLRARAETYVRQLNGRHFNEPRAESIPCPLLVDERCSVYALRPLVCRGYNSTSVDSCRRAHSDTAVTVPIFAMLKDVTDGATLGTLQCLEAMQLSADLVDLGTALALGLSAGPGFEASALTCDGLRTAADSSWRRRLIVAVRKTARDCGREIGDAAE